MSQYDIYDRIQVQLRSSAMPITPFLRGQAFGPEIIEAMGMALENVCATLGLRNKSDPLTILVAQTIIELAERGINTADQLSEAALTEIKRSGAADRSLNRAG